MGILPQNETGNERRWGLRCLGGVGGGGGGEFAVWRVDGGGGCGGGGGGGQEKRVGAGRQGLGWRRRRMTSVHPG